MFGRATIRLGICPHSSLYSITHMKLPNFSYDSIYTGSCLLLSKNAALHIRFLEILIDNIPTSFVENNDLPVITLPCIQSKVYQNTLRALRGRSTTTWSQGDSKLFIVMPRSFTAEHTGPVCSTVKDHGITINNLISPCDYVVYGRPME